MDLRKTEIIPLKQNLSGAGGHGQNNGYTIVHGYISGFVCIIGILGNVFNIIVWTKSSHSSSANYILTALSVSDLLTVSFYVIFTVYIFVVTGPNDTFYHSEAGIYLTLVCFHAFIVSCLLSSFFTITLAVFRYIKISRPLESRKVCSLHRAKLAIFLVYLSVNIFVIPFYFYYDVHDLSKENNPNGYWIHKTDFAIHHEQSYQVVSLWLAGIIMKLVPCMALIVVSIYMIFALKGAGETQRTLVTTGNACKLNQINSDTYRRTSLMLITILIIYALTSLPIGITSFVGALMGGEGEYFYFLGYSHAGCGLDLFPLTNATLNFFVYLIMCEQYRRNFKFYILRQIVTEHFHTMISTAVSDGSIAIKIQNERIRMHHTS